MTDTQPPTVLATIDDFAARLGRPLAAGADTERAQAALDDAASLIGTRGTFTQPVPAAVMAVCCSAALRRFNNPAEWTSERVGEWSGSRDDAASIGLYLTPYEEGVIQRYSGATQRGLWTLGTTRCDPIDPVYGYDGLGGDPILLADNPDLGVTSPDGYLA
jgi:hypothetical protein